MTWHAELDDLVRRGREALGDDAVAEALSAAAEGLAPDEVPAFSPPEPVLGTAPCATGVLGVLARPGGRVTVHVARSAAALVGQVGDALEEEGVLVLEAAAVPADAEELLTRAGLSVPPWYSGSGFERDDLVAACWALVADQRPDGAGESSASRR